MTKQAGPDKGTWYVADDTVIGESGRVGFGEARRGDDPLVAATFAMWVPSPATADQLRSHAGARQQAAFDAAVADREKRQAAELEHGPLEMTAAEKGHK